MILKRLEITLVGPDDYPADERSYAKWEQRERYALSVLAEEMEWFQRRVDRRLEDPEFEVEIVGLDRRRRSDGASLTPAPSDIPLG